MNNLKYIIKKIIPKIIFDNISLGPKIDPPIQHNRPIRQPFPWNRMNATLKEINPISSMITEDESLYLNWLAKDYYKGIGEIVDAGPYLGGSTYAFASGLEKNIKVAEKFNRIHSYDIFEYMPGSEASLTYPTDKLEAGDSILPFFKQNIKPFKKNVKIYPGNILNFHWDGKSIEVLFIDLSKSWDVNNYIIKEFFGHLIPNHSIVIQQDYFHFMCYWIHITMQFFSNYFKILPSPDGTTLSFKLIKKIPNDLSNINFYSHLSKGELINLLE